MDRSQNSPKTIQLTDYRPPDFLIHKVDLYFHLSEEKTQVRSTLSMQRNNSDTAPLVLDGEQLELISVRLNDEELTTQQYTQDDHSLTIREVPDRFTINITTEIDPAANTSLEGLYQSSGNYCSQCEAEGFRKISYYLDRPDVMAEFTTTIEADKSKYPVLLSNGNRINSGDIDDHRHWVCWHDPHKKPCYLFALVAGDLTINQDHYITTSGRQVELQIYTERHNTDKTDHAMASLKHAMQWDEQNFGLEYDLDIYMIVAVDDFNMGAMENKGLNIFNSKYVLATPATATDHDYIGIEAVIAHEYFHNWTGNRVTCRDWFQLSLKEGLTVFRDESFTADLNSPAVKRIDDVRILRSHQFPEDAGPMAHPIRPQSYIEINNFYTVTVYNKGAEVVRLYETLLGKDGFRLGMDLYFQRHDGQAVTTDDFRQAMADANDTDLSQLQNWYDQAGTPSLSIEEHWDEVTGQYRLDIQQHCPATPEQENKQPFLVPIRTKLLDPQGNALTEETLLTLTENTQSFLFNGLHEKPIPSLLRGFSAPVKINFPYQDQHLALLMAHDDDDFNRWEAGQNLAMRVLLKLIDKIQQGEDPKLDHNFIEAFRKTLNSDADPALIAEAMTLPSEGDIAQQLDPLDPEVVFQARQFVRQNLAQALQQDLQTIYAKHQLQGDYTNSAKHMAHRRLKNCALAYLCCLDQDEMRQQAFLQFQQANNMTDSLAALRALSGSESPQRQQALDLFYERWNEDALVLDNWFIIQASSSLPNDLETIHELLNHPKFTLNNPNRVRALIGTFAQSNPRCFHWHNGSGYRLIADQIIQLDQTNPQIAARLVRVFTRWKRLEENRRGLMKTELERIKSQRTLSKDVFEIVEKSLV